MIIQINKAWINEYKFKKSKNNWIRNLVIKIDKNQKKPKINNKN